MKRIVLLVVFLNAVLAWQTSIAWDPRELSKLDAGAQEALAKFKEKDPSMQAFLDAAAGYAVFPTVGKGGIGIGGAHGKGLLYEVGKPSAIVSLTQLTVGFQWGGQAYSEFIFFEKKSDVDNFKQGNFELGAQVSAVAVTLGASADANYKNGVAVFTQAKGGLMYEASVGGQKFKVELVDKAEPAR